MNEALITPSVLKWARESSGYSVHDAVAKVKLKNVTEDVFAKWETGELRPSYASLRKLAAAYKRPIAIFYFPKPPEEDTISKDFRRALPEQTTQAIPTTIRHLVRKAKIRQIELEELHFGIKTNPKIIELQTTERDVTPLAQKMREEMGISLDTQKRFSNADNALKAWRQAVEKLGIWVFKDSFGKENENYCGFCIYDTYFPVIYINSYHSSTRQIFTLFHELAHLLGGTAGIDFRKTPTNLPEKYNKEEVFCNKFAGEFLVSQSSFGTYQALPNDNEVWKIAKQYKVSYDVILRKFLDSNLISREDYESKIDEANKRYSDSKDKSKNIPINSYVIRKSHLGEKYVSLAFEQYYSQRIDCQQLVGYLGSKKASALEEFERLL